MADQVDQTKAELAVEPDDAAIMIIEIIIFIDLYRLKRLKKEINAILAIAVPDGV